MKAALVTTFTEPLTIVERDVPEPGHGGVGHIEKTVPSAIGGDIDHELGRDQGDLVCLDQPTWPEEA